MFTQNLVIHKVLNNKDKFNKRYKTEQDNENRSQQCSTWLYRIEPWEL